MATYTLSKRALKFAKDVTDRHQHVLGTDWGESQPNAADENRSLASHSWEDYADWHLGSAADVGRALGTSR